MKNTAITKEQSQSIANYRRMGIDIEVLSKDTVKVSQTRLINGYISNQKELHLRAKRVFPDMHIVPVVYSLSVEDINMDWVKSKMKEFGIKRKDLIKQLAIDHSTLSLLFTGERGLTKSQKAAFFYYFLVYELNRDFKEL